MICISVTGRLGTYKDFICCWIFCMFSCLLVKWFAR